MKRGSRGVALGLLLIAAAAAAPAAADWLQMRDGSRVQTRGPWQVKGAMVQFTLPNGTLASLRAADVDLDASARITAEAVAPPAPAATPAPTPRPQAVLTITDADLAPAAETLPVPAAPVGAAATAATTPRPAAAPASAAESDPGAGLEVVSWETRYDVESNTTTLTGTLRNTGATLAYDVSIVVSTFDPEGGALTTSDARLAAPGIAPGRSAGFRVAFPGALRIERAEFELGAKRASTGLPPPDPEPTPLPTPQPSARAAAGVAGEGAQRLRVTRWEADTAADTLSLVGEMTNQSAQTVYGLSLTVTLQDAAERSLASARALLAATSLQPGQSTTFRASFPGVREYHSVRFQAREGTTP